MSWIDVQQNTDEWQKLRLGKATASNFGCFMANYGNAFGEPAKRYGFTNEHMERGHEQEPVAKMLYAEEHFADITNGGFFDCGEYGDSPDGLVGTVGLVEVKSVIAPTHYANMQRGTFDPAYKWQLVGHLDCSGRQWVDFISYCAEFPADTQLCVYRLHREQCEDELNMLRTRRAEFLELVKTTMSNIQQRSSVWQA
jgi:hypothetical protein